MNNKRFKRLIQNSILQQQQQHQQKTIRPYACACLCLFVCSMLALTTSNKYTYFIDKHNGEREARAAAAANSAGNSLRSKFVI